MKVCSQCKKEKPLNSFSKDKSTKDGLQTGCIDCRKISSKKCYENYKEKVYWRNVGRFQIYRKKVYTYLMEYCKTHPCVDCGEEDFVVLEFDHVQGKKLDGISNMVTNKKSLELIIEELKKCEVRCANCHRRITAKRGNYYSCFDEK